MPLLLLETNTLQEENSITPESLIFERADKVLSLLSNMLSDYMTEDFKSFVLTLPGGKNADNLLKATKEKVASYFNTIL